MFNFSSGITATQNDQDTQLDETVDSTKNTKNNVTTNGVTNTDTVNSGSTNTSKSSTNNSGSVNTIDVSGTTSRVANSGRVDTSQVMLGPDALNYLVKQALESNQGLAAVTSGQKATGGYNSTASTLLTNNLLANIAGEVAVRGAKTVNTIGESSQMTVNSGQTTTQKIGASSSDTDVLNIIGGNTSSSKSTNANITDATGLENVLANKNSYQQVDDRKTQESASGSFGWIICTELAAQKKLNLKFYLSGLAVFNSYKDEYKKGYYIWGVPVVKHIRKYPNGLITKLWVSISNARIEYLAALGGNKRAKKTVYGFIMTHTLYWACVLFSKTIARNYTLTSAD